MRSVAPAAALLASLLLAPLQAEEVRLPLADYHRLVESSVVPVELPVVPAAPFALHGAEVTLELQESSAVAQSVLTLSLHGDTWIPIPRADLVGETKVMALDSGPFEGRLGQDGTTLVLRGRGVGTITLTEAVPLEEHEASSLERRTLAYTLPRAAHVTGTIRGVGRRGVLRVHRGGFLLEDNGSTATFVGAPGERLELITELERPSDTRDALPLRFSALTWSHLEIGRTQTRLVARARTSVHQGTQNEVEIVLPAAFELLAVDATPTSTWELGDDGRTLIVRPEERARAGMDVTVRMRRESVSPVATPTLDVQGAVRHQRLATASTAGDGLLSLHDLGDAIETHPDEVRGTLATALSWVENAGTGGAIHQRSPTYLLRERPLSWSVVWPESTEVLTQRIDELGVEALLGLAGDTVYRLRLKVTTHGSDSVELRMPSGFRLIRAERDGSRVRSAVGVTPSDLVLPLSKFQGSHDFDVVGVIPLPDWQEAETLLLPLPEATAPITQVRVRAHVPRDWSPALQESHRALRMSSPGPFESAALQAPPGFTRIDAQWSAMSTRPEALRIHLDPDPARKEWF